jgi:TPR repeat protein
LFAQAIVSGREEELSADERRLAGESFLDSGNEVEARRHLEYAAQAGIPQAAVTLGLRLIGRQQSVEDWQPGLPYFQTAAQAGDAHAMFLLGYYFDEIVRRNVGAVDWRALAQPSQPGPAAASEAELQSLHWYRKAAELGHARAAAKMEGRD